MRVLITGGAGYIGSNGAFAFLDKGHKVTIVDNLKNGNKKLIPKKSKFIKSDIGDTKKIEKLIKNKKFDIVIHYAALTSVPESFKYPKKYYENNYKKSKKFLKTCLKYGLNKIVYSSSAGVYGDSKNYKIKENRPLKPKNPYAKSKLKFEKYLKKMEKKNKLKYTILRYFNVGGADKKMRSGLIKNKGNLIKTLSEVAAKKRKKITIFGNNYRTKDGTTVRDYIHVTDLSKMHLIAAEKMFRDKNFKSNIFNCGYGFGFSTKEVVNLMEKILNTKINFEYGKKRVGDIEISISNVSKFRKNFKWFPKNKKYNSIKNILKSSYNWEKKFN